MKTINVPKNKGQKLRSTKKGTLKKDLILVDAPPETKATQVDQWLGALPVHHS
jgi:hypothetical protein